MFSQDEISILLQDAETHVLENISDHVTRLKHDWNKNYDPEEHFGQFEESVRTFVNEISRWRPDGDYKPALAADVGACTGRYLGYVVRI